MRPLRELLRPFASDVANSSSHNPLIKQSFPYAPALMGEALPGFRRHGGVKAVNARFDDSRHRVLAAHAAMAAAERECLRATADEVVAFCAEAGLGSGMLAVFHAAPRGEAVWELDDRDCSREDAVLQAVDLADVDGRRMRLTRGGLLPLPRDARPPVTSLGLHDDASRLRLAVGTRTALQPPTDPLGGALWQRAVLAWVDLHRALACWTGRWLAASLVVAPENGDIASLEPLYCPDRGQDFEVVTSLRLAPESVPADDLEAALANVLDEPDGVTPDMVELDLNLWLNTAGVMMPGFPAHGPGECESSADEI
jgi:hypothetical protein